MSATALELRTALEAQGETLYGQDFGKYLPMGFTLEGGSDPEADESWFSIVVRDEPILNVFVNGPAVTITPSDHFADAEVEILAILNRAVNDKLRATRDAAFAASRIDRFDMVYADIAAAAKEGNATTRLANKLLVEAWDHDQGAHRIESLAAYYPEVGEKITRLALRFISERGMSDLFADVLEEVPNVMGEDEPVHDDEAMSPIP